MGLIVCAGLLTMGACESSPSTNLTVDPTASYDGPPVRRSVVEGEHVVAIVVPSGGWELLGENIDREFRDNRVYVTLVRPDPEMMHTQARMSFNVTTGVRADEPLAVYVRIVDHGAEPNDARFVLAETFAPVRP
jgi:hypothetical protein